MKNNIKKIFITLASTLGAVLLVTTATYAIGNLTPGNTPGEATQYTLNDIYTKLADFSTATSTASGLFTIPGTIEESFYTLTDIYTLLEAEDTDLVASNIATGTVIFGVEGTLEEGVVYPTEWSANNPVAFVDWPTAVAYCDHLQEDGSTVNVAVQNIWRLPTYMELVNALLTGVSGFAQDDGYWSNTDYLEDSNYAYYVGAAYASSYGNIKTSSDGHTRCIR